MNNSLSKKIKHLYKSPIFIVSLFVILSLIGILNHVMWRDEMNTWLIVRDSNSWHDLIYNIKSDRGHPGLWHFSVALLRNLVDNPVIMQLFHWSLAVITIILFWLYSPFNHLQKALFTFGYCPLYEYTLISRNYGLGICLLFAFCVVFSSRYQTYLILAVLLGLIANVNVYSLLISMALISMLTLEFVLDRQLQQIYLNKSKIWDVIISISIVIFCFALAAYFIIPPVDNNPNILGEQITTFDLRHLFKILGRFFGGYTLIVPNSKRWIDLIICGSIAIGIFGINCSYLSKKIIPLFFYITANSGLFLFMYSKHLTISIRHLGHYYFIMIIALWLANYYQENKLKWKYNFNFLPIKASWHHYLFMIILYIQLGGGIYKYINDLIVPFSASKAAANYIIKSNLNQEFIVASRDVNMASVSGYLNRKLYYPELEELGSFFLFSQRGFDNVTHDEVLKQIKDILSKKTQLDRILMILNKEVKSTRNDLQIIPIEKFKKSYLSGERYYLYWVSLK